MYAFAHRAAVALALCLVALIALSVPFSGAQANPMANEMFGFSNRNEPAARSVSSSRRGYASEGRSSRRSTRAARTEETSSYSGYSERTERRRSARTERAERPQRAYGGSVASSGGINYVASSGCLNSTLQSAISEVASQYGSVRVSSTCRSSSQNARAGGAPRSHHLTGNAADFRVFGGNTGAVYAALRSNPSLGGVKHYGGGLFHIDTGPKRSW